MKPSLFEGKLVKNIEHTIQNIYVRYETCAIDLTAKTCFLRKIPIKNFSEDSMNDQGR